MALDGLSEDNLKNVVNIKNTTSEIVNYTRQLNKEFSKLDQATANVNSEFSGIVSGADKFVKIQQEAAKSSKATSQAVSEQTKQLGIVKTLNIQIDELYRRAAKETGGTADILKLQARYLADGRDNAQGLANEYGRLAEDAASIDKKTTWFSALSAVSKDIPGLRELSGPFEAAAKASRETVINNAKNEDIQDRINKLKSDPAVDLKTGKGLTKERLKQYNLSDLTGKKAGSNASRVLETAAKTAKTQSAGAAGLSAGFKALGPILKKALGPIGILLTVKEIIENLVKAMFEASAMSAKFSNSMLMGREAAKDTRLAMIDQVASFNSIEKSQNRLTISQAQYMKTLDDINASLGLQLNLITGFGIETSNNVAYASKLNKQWGLSAEATSQLFMDAERLGVPVQEYVEELAGGVASLYAQSGLVGDLNKDIESAAKISGNLRANFGGSTSELVSAVFQAKLLGMTLDQTQGIASGLLDFESSIASELEAELLLGKDLNLEKAREYALMGDTVGLMKEISREAGTQEDFLNMNMKQRDSLAAALKMEVNALADMFQKESELAALQKKSDEIRLIAQKEFGDVVLDNNDIQQFGLVELYDRLKAAGTAEEEINKQLAARVTLRKEEQSASQKFQDSMEKLREVFSKLVDGGTLDKLADAAQALGDTLASGGSLFSVFGESDFQKSSREKREERETERFTSLESMSGETRSKAEDEEYGMLKGKREAEARNDAIAQQRINSGFGASGGLKDFISRPGLPIQSFSEDDIIIGATKPFRSGGDGSNNEVAMLLKELISEIRSGGDVYLDSTKVGTALTVGSYKMQ
tara:strand:+ start:1150 stop:3606 length:2457 start_codon:yes stop_codon:yes gene_type:complete